MARTTLKAAAGWEVAEGVGIFLSKLISFRQEHLLSLCKTLLLVQVFLPNGKPHRHILVLSSLTLPNSAWRTAPEGKVGSDAITSVGTLLEHASHRVHRVGKEAPLVATICPHEVKPILYAGLRGRFSDLVLNHSVTKLVSQTQEPEEKTLEIKLKNRLRLCFRGLSAGL